ncbi:MAG: ATPase [Candidatus Nomurabacteria bacterium GW2011_GWC2_35_35]|nr:MAG: ATPase [Candidatus Nomurabacteria bacterium GW2011_GWC2_35_35]
METKWYLLSQEQIFEKLHTSLHGLTPSDVQDKIKQYGFNILPEKKPTSLIRLFFNQFNSPLILILLLASVITYIIGGTTDAYIILAVLIFNAIVGMLSKSLLKQKQQYCVMVQNLLFQIVK